MRILLLFLPLISSEIISYSIPEGPNQILAGLLTTDQYSFITNHGCFCSKTLDLTSKHLNYLRGGNQAVDNLDEICKIWFRNRSYDQINGGACNYGIQPTTYTYLGPNVTCQDAALTSVNNECQTSTCQIDQYFSTAIVEYFDQFPVENLSQILITQSSEANCTNNLASLVENKITIGEVPNLRVKALPLTDLQLKSNYQMNFKIKINSVLSTGSRWFTGGAS